MKKYYIGSVEYVPGKYDFKRPEAAELAQRYVARWKNMEKKSRENFRWLRIPPCICISRKVGVGALEIADVLSKETGYPVVDRAILEHIADNRDLSEETVLQFDEHYSGKLKEFLNTFTGAHDFNMNDYLKDLFQTVLSIAGMGSCIFVGRGTHLLLPRERVLAVRFIAEKDFRAKRLSALLGVDVEQAMKKLNQIDSEQREFYKRIYERKTASPYEFDLVINRFFFRKPLAIAELVELAFKRKFGPEVDNSAS